MLAGNATVFASLASVQLVVLLVVYFVIRRDRPFAEALETVRFPAILLCATASLFQGSLIASLSMLTEGSELMSISGAAGLVWSVTLPVVVVLGVRRVPRRFMSYVYLSRASRLYQFRSLLPVGVVMPSSVRKASSALISGLTRPSVLFAMSPFVSPLLLAVATMVPRSAPRSACQAALWVSCVLHVALAAAIVVVRTHRSPPSCFAASIGLLLTAVGHILIASNAPVSTTDALMLVQSGFAIFRSVVLLLMILVEARMMVSASIVFSAQAMWKVGDGGASFEQALPIPTLTLIEEAVLPASAGTGDFDSDVVEVNQTFDDDCLPSAPAMSRREELLLAAYDARAAQEASLTAERCLADLRQLSFRRQKQLANVVDNTASAMAKEVVPSNALRIIVLCIASRRKAERLQGVN